MKNLFLAILTMFTLSLANVSIADETKGEEATEQGEEKKKDSSDC